MKIGRNAVVSVEYTLKNDKGETLDESGGEPLTYIHGQGQLVPGLERALEGKARGETVNAVVAPKDGYGVKNKSAKAIEVPLDQFPEGEGPEVGMAIEAVGEGGETTTLWVVEKNEQSVKLSLDHPLAGVTLHFQVQIGDVRAATKEELAHGHVHGPGGHHHH